MLTIDRARHVRTGEPLRLFFVRRGDGKAVALGCDGAFLQAMRARYERDTDMMRAVEKLAGMKARAVYAPAQKDNARVHSPRITGAYHGGAR